MLRHAPFQNIIKKERKKESGGEAVLIKTTKSIYSRILVEKGEGREIQRKKLIKFTKGGKEKENS